MGKGRVSTESSMLSIDPCYNPVFFLVFIGRIMANYARKFIYLYKNHE